MGVLMKLRSAAYLDRRHRSAGWSILELMVVLVAIGYLISIVYQRRADAKESERQTQYLTQITQIVSGAQDWMQTWTTTGTAGTNLTSAAVQASVFPSDTNPSAGPYTPWGGLYSVTANGVDSFQVQATSISQAGCNKALAKQTSSASQAGLTSVTVNGAAVTMPVNSDVCTNSGNNNTIVYTWVVN